MIGQEAVRENARVEETQEEPVQVELTVEAEDLVRRKGGTVLVDYIRPTG